FCQVFSCTAETDSTDGKNASHSPTLGFFEDITGDCWIVIDRIGVGHATDGGKPTGGRCLRATFDGFFIFAPRLPQVDVKVDESWRHDQCAGIEPLVDRMSYVFFYPRHFPILN